ncbi:unnamed protein product [Lactuca virosa]|uniref:Uncharacterized protein n=1 Tax=Lactuca virosa TaxID=75947 RepID=A0AAU9PNP6_9ASTR|nr:unnamed protein product [Lactuca virosa]
MCLAACKESGREGVEKEIIVGTFDAGEIADSIDAFITCDYAALMQIGKLDIDDVSVFDSYFSSLTQFAWDKKPAAVGSLAKKPRNSLCKGYNPFHQNEAGLKSLMS